MNWLLALELVNLFNDFRARHPSIMNGNNELYVFPKLAFCLALLTFICIFIFVVRVSRGKN